VHGAEGRASTALEPVFPDAPRGHLPALAPCMFVLLGPELAASVEGHGVNARPVADFFPELAAS
jgi:hypothetical protein